MKKILSYLSSGLYKLAAKIGRVSRTRQQKKDTKNALESVYKGII